MSEFYDSFNPVLSEMESAFGEENWEFPVGTPWPAISIDSMLASDKVAKGGRFNDASTKIYVRQEVFENSGVKKDAIIKTRNTTFAVMEIDDDGDASRTLICGPSDIDIWR